METATAKQGTVTDSDCVRAETIRRRNEHMEQGRRRVRSWRTAEVCCECGRDIAPGEVIARIYQVQVGGLLGTTRRLMVLCEDCARAYRGRYFQEERTCAFCGRVVWRGRYWARRYKRRVFCCERCQWSYYNARQVASRAKDRAGAECVVCGQPFEPARAGALYCSDACRQRAYRQRKAAESVTDSNCAAGVTVAKCNMGAPND